MDTFPPHELTRIRELWDYFDLDGDGTISREDMKFGLSMLAENFIANDSVSQGIANQYLQRKINAAMLMLERAQERARSAAGHRGTRSSNNNAEEDVGHGEGGGVATPRGAAAAALSPRAGAAAAAAAPGKSPGSVGNTPGLAGALSPGTIAMWVDADKVRIVEWTLRGVAGPTPPDIHLRLGCCPLPTPNRSPGGWS